MCNTPRRIPQNKRNFDPRLHQIFSDVPCGHCQQCIQEYVDGWTLRGIAHYEDVKAHGGDAFSFTLTYNEKCLPWFHDDKYNIHIPVFNREDIKRFKKNVFRELRKYLGVKPNDISTIIACEYGKQRTCRSHYHGNIYIKNCDLSQLPDSFFQRILERSWRTKLTDRSLSRCKDRIKYTKLLGRVSGSKKFGYVIKTRVGAIYCIKYVAKDFVFYQDENLRNAMKDPVFRARIKPHLPFHVQSMHFGESFKKTLLAPENFDYLVEGKIPLLDSGKSVYNYKIPTYLLQKTIYEKNEHGLYQLNDLGKKVKAEQVNTVIEKTHDYLSQCFQHEYVNSHWNIFSVALKKIYGNRYDFKTPDEFISNLNYVLGNRSLYDLTSYYLVYRDLPCKDIHGDYSLEMLSYNLEALVNKSYDLLFERILTYGLPEKESYFKINPGHLQYYKYNRCNDFPAFRGFDHILNQINLFYTSIQQNINLTKEREASEVRRRRERYYNNLFNNA